MHAAPTIDSTSSTLFHTGRAAIMYECAHTAASTTEIAMATHAIHFGTVPPSADLRAMAKNATATTTNTTIAISSCVMPLVKCPKPLKMRSQCCRWKNTATPDAARSTQLKTVSSCCDFLPAPASASTPWQPNTPADQATSVVNKIKGHCNSMLLTFLHRHHGAGGRPAPGRAGGNCRVARASLGATFQARARPRRAGKRNNHASHRHSCPCHCSLRRMYTNPGSLPTFGR